MSAAPWIVPFVVQGLVMVVDEGWFHRRRGLPRWERVGHPLDTLTVAACFAWIALQRPDARGAMGVYVTLAVVSCLFVTKDEPVHKALCSPTESWLHALLFLLHPVVFVAAAMLWVSGQARGFLAAQLALTLVFAAYQALYWGPWNRTPTRSAA